MEPIIPKYTLGTWLMGGQKDKDDTANVNADIKAIRTHIQYGVKSIFAAQNYANGYTEEITGKAIKPFNRNKLIISTAVRKEHKTHQAIIDSVKNSLKRLQTEYIDLLYHHTPVNEMPIEEIMEAFNHLHKKKLIHHIALSNYPLDLLKKAIKISKLPIKVNQVYYNLFIRGAETTKLLKFCQQNDIILQAYRPLEKGILTASGNYKLVTKLCQKYAITPTQLALTWLTSQQNVAVTCTTHNIKHLIENLNGIRIKLEDQDIEKLRQDFPIQTDGGEIGRLI